MHEPADRLRLVAEARQHVLQIARDQATDLAMALIATAREIAGSKPL